MTFYTSKITRIYSPKQWWQNFGSRAHAARTISERLINDIFSNDIVDK